jgi:hypothetical protein
VTTQECQNSCKQMEPALVLAIAARPPGITGDSEFSCARAGVQRERYGRKPSASCASHLPGVPQGNALHRLKVRPSHVPVRPMRRRRSHAIVRRTCLDERRIAAAETAIRSLAGLIGNRNQSSSSIHSVPRHYRMRQWTGCSASLAGSLPLIHLPHHRHCT